VPLDEVLIKLHPEGFHEAFDADGINVGSGGISMRASMLPQVGSTLRCHLDNPAGGEAIEMIGRVVWAHDSGEHAGEFGIRFTHLSSDDQLRIEALIQRWGRASASAPTVRLQLDGVESSIMAEIQTESDDSLTVEQPLPFLEIGSGVQNEQSGRRGHLEAVELRMDEATPRLVLSIGYEELAIERESGIEDAARDTLPDEPPVVRASGRSVERAHDTPRVVRYDHEAEVAATQGVTERLRSYAKSTTHQIASAASGAKSAITEGLVPSATSKVRELVALLLRFAGALRARLDEEKPRRQQVPRSQAARAHLKNTRRNSRRYLVLVAMVAGIVSAGWGIYLWAAGGSMHEAPEQGEPEAAAEPASTQAPTSKPAAAVVADASPAPSEAVAPIAQGAPLPPESVKGTVFGADSVARGETYVLRMSNPVAEMDGIVEDDGFSVTIPGSLSLSRAGPIASSHPDVEHASILNRGDFSELTIRFVAGRRPAYRVEARGPAIHLTIAR
jgi:hypothetical protein